MPIGVDAGIAVFPEDGHDAASLFASADKSLYASKQKAYDQSGKRIVSSLVVPSPIEEVVTPVQVVTSLSDGRPTHIPTVLADPTRIGVEVRGSDASPNARRCERIRLEGTPALGVVRLGLTNRTVRVLDVSPGGICLLADQEDLPENFPVRLQLPLLPEKELTLRRVYSLLLPGGKRRVGCSFTGVAEPSPASTVGP
jgi:hypothetical protein